MTAEDGFGEKDDEAMFEVEKTDFPNHGEVKPGDEFLAEGPEGESIAMRVVEVLDETFVVDANHPLAGQTLRFEVLVSEVRPATEEEIAEAQSDLEDMIERADDEPCCDHDHGDHTHTHEHDEQPRLVQLAKKS